MTRPARRPAPRIGCGPCDLCCTVLGVAEFGKPEGVACDRLRPGGGCRAYAERPGSCRDFRCAWLASAEQGTPLPGSLRPDRCGVVFHRPIERGGDNLIAHVDPARPRAWLSGDAMATIAGFALEGGTAAVVAAGRRYVVDASGIHEATVAALLPDGGLSLAKGRRIGRIA